MNTTNTANARSTAKASNAANDTHPVDGSNITNCADATKTVNPTDATKTTNPTDATKTTNPTDATKTVNTARTASWSAQQHQVATVADLIATSFASLAVSKWLVADPEERIDALRAQFRMIVEHAAEHGAIYLDPGHTAAAVWLDYTRPVPEPADYDRRLLQACGQHTSRFAALDAAFEEHHPTAAHHHLAFMAVDPEHQERGLGSALLAQHHRVLDEAGVPAYLEAANLRAARLYGRWGYRIISRIDLPRGPSMWPMWREPRR